MSRRHIRIDMGPLDDWGARDVAAISVIGRSSKDPNVAVGMVELQANHQMIARMSSAKAREIAQFLIDAAAAADTDAAALKYLMSRRYDEQTVLRALAMFADRRLTMAKDDQFGTVQQTRDHAMRTIRQAEASQLTIFMRDFLSRRGVKGEDLESVIGGLEEALCAVTDEPHIVQTADRPPAA